MDLFPETGTDAAAAGYHLQQLLERIGDVPPVDFEEEYYRNQLTQAVVA